MVQDTFRRFAEEKLAPVAEHIHRHNDDIPEEHHRRAGRDGRLRPVDPRGVRRLRDRRRVRLHRHGRRHRGAVPRLARRRRLAHHPARDPRPGPRGRRHRGAEAALAAPARHRRGHERRRRHRARLRLRRGRRQGHRDPDRRRLAHQRRQDLVHLRRPGRRADAAGPHRPRPLASATAGLSMFIVPKARGDGHGFELAQDRATTAAARWRAARSTPSATAACTPTRSPSTTGSCPART